MLTKHFTPPNKIGYSLFFFILLLVAAAGLAASLNPAQAQSGNGKYDTDGDRLIEVSSWQQLHAIHFDLDGNGSSDNDSYATAYPVGSNESVCDLSCNGYELSRSLDFDSADGYGAGGWLPIRGFNATFDGNGRTISNLYLDVDLQSNQANAGLFGWINVNAVIKNIGLLNVDVSGAGNVGGLVGSTSARWSNNRAVQSQISNSYVTGTVSGTGNHNRRAGRI